MGRSLRRPNAPPTRLQKRNGNISGFEALLTYWIPLLVTALIAWLLLHRVRLALTLSAWAGVGSAYFASFAWVRWQRMSEADRADLSNIGAAAEQAMTQVLWPKINVQWVFWAMTAALVCWWLARMAQVQRSRIVLLLVALSLVFTAHASLMIMILWNGIYLSDTQPIVWRVLYVTLPALGLTLVWLGSWWRQIDPVQRMVFVPEMLFDGTAEDAATSPSDRFRESNLGWLAVFSLPLSATLLLATSGTLSIALKAAIAVVVPVAHFIVLRWGGRFSKRPHASSKWHGRELAEEIPATLSAWLGIAVGVPLICGCFFGAVSAWLAALFFLSLLLVPLLWPSREQSLTARWCLATVSLAPALVAAIISAVQTIIALS